MFMISWFRDFNFMVSCFCFVISCLWFRDFMVSWFVVSWFCFLISWFHVLLEVLDFSGTCHLPGANCDRCAFVFSVSVISWFHIHYFVVSWFQDLWISWFRGSASWFHFMISWFRVHDFVVSWFQNLGISWFRDFVVRDFSRIGRVVKTTKDFMVFEVFQFMVQMLNPGPVLAIPNCFGYSRRLQNESLPE